MSRPTNFNTQGDWMTVRRRIEEMLSRDRSDLESPGVAIEKTEMLRGRIDAMKDLIEHFEPTTPKIEG